MRSWIKKIFFDNWQRKLVSLILAMIIWIVVNHSLTSVQTYAEIPVKVINIPTGKTVEGLLPNGTLKKKVSLTLTGHSSTLKELSGNDLEIIVDAENKGNEWAISVNKNNLISLNKNIDVAKSITKISHPAYIVALCNFVTEKIPILVSKPIGEAPAGYQYLDIWPYHLYITVSGPENIVKDLQSRGLKLSLNLNDISKTELSALHSAKQKDEISFFVPDSWKKINIPEISSSPIEIDDPQAKLLRIDFSLSDLLPIQAPIPIVVYYPLKYSKMINPSTYPLMANDYIQSKNNIYMITQPLMAKGVSRVFLDAVKNMIEIVVVAAPETDKKNLLWNTQFVYPHELENNYVAKTLAQATEQDFKGLQPHHQEEYLRNRFRNYMNRFRLYTPNDEKLFLKIELKEHSITITPQVTTR